MYLEVKGFLTAYLNDHIMVVDIAAPKGSPVLAPIKSIVRMAEKDLYYTGGTIMLDHGHGVTSVYSHLSVINVKLVTLLLKGKI